MAKLLLVAALVRFVLELTVLDAVIGGLATAFFGALVAGSAYVLKQQISLREDVSTLRLVVERLGRIQDRLRTYGDVGLETETLKRPDAPSGGDGPAR